MRMTSPFDPTCTFTVETPDPDIDTGAGLAAEALWRGATPKAGVLVPTVCGAGSHYPQWVHPYDNYWINRVSSYFFARESTEWPIRLFVAYQSPLGEIAGGVYEIPAEGWQQRWEEVGGPAGWQPYVARPLAGHVATQAGEPDQVRYGIYVRDHLFVLQVYDQWQARGSLPFLIEMYGPCRRALKYLEQQHDSDGNGLIETSTILSDVVVAGDRDIHSTERAEDQVMLYGALLAFAEMADRLGGGADAAWARGWAERVKPELNARMWRAEGRYIYGLDTRSKAPRLDYVTATYANGYGILFGLADGAQSTAILDFMARQSFAVPGPYYIPPVRQEDGPVNAPGVYVNGGCGWGRGIMPSVALACFRHGRTGQAVDYLHRQARAARQAGSFHEYWTWEQYAGKTEPGGAPWYCETSAGYLDALLHGLFGLSPARPGFAALRLEPHFPASWDRARLGLRLPQGAPLTLEYAAAPGSASLAVGLPAGLPVELALPWAEAMPPTVEGTGLLDWKLQGEAGEYKVLAGLDGGGQIRLRRA